MGRSDRTDRSGGGGGGGVQGAQPPRERSELNGGQCLRWGAAREASAPFPEGVNPPREYPLMLLISKPQGRYLIRGPAPRRFCRTAPESSARLPQRGTLRVGLKGMPKGKAYGVG